MYVKYIQIFKSLEECYDQVMEREREITVRRYMYLMTLDITDSLLIVY